MGLPPVVGGIRAGDHHVSRAHPCTARNLPPLDPEVCGVTPTRPYRRTCTHGHDDTIWLCDPHAMVIMTAPCHCARCADRGGAVEAVLVPDPESLRLLDGQQLHRDVDLHPAAGVRLSVGHVTTLPDAAAVRPEDRHRFTVEGGARAGPLRRHVDLPAEQAQPGDLISPAGDHHVPDGHDRSVPRETDV